MKLFTVVVLLILLLIAAAQADDTSGCVTVCASPFVLEHAPSQIRQFCKVCQSGGKIVCHTIVGSAKPHCKLESLAK